MRKDNQTLLIRRANGRESILGKFELPGGKIEYKEQPEDALRRYLRKDIGLMAQTVQLFDVISYIDHDDPEIQYVFIVYLVSVENADVVLSDNYDKSVWQTKSKIQHRDITESSQIILGLSGKDIPTEEDIPIADDIDVKDTTKSRYILYSDGGSRGNPGPSAAAYVIEKSSGEVLERGGEYIGITTSYQAEYQGLRMGLERMLELGYTYVECRLDNLMVVNQMKGIYTVKNRELWPINERVLDLITQFEDVHFVHVRREFNTLADAEVNKVLDGHSVSRDHADTLDTNSV